MIEPEMVGHVLIPLNWKQFVARGCSFNLKSVLGAGLTHRRRARRSWKQTVFFTSTQPMDEIGE